MLSNTRKTTRWCSLLSLIPTIFAFIAIILINIGGVNPATAGRSIGITRFPVSSYYGIRDTPFEFLSWNYTVDSNSTAGSGVNYTSYTCSIYLNRVCWSYNRELNATEGYQFNQGCFNGGPIGTLRDGTDFPAPTVDVQIAAPFRFDSINFNPPLALYILAALFCALLMLQALLGSFSKRGSKTYPIGFAFCFLAYTFLLSASAYMTHCMFRLQRQIGNPNNARLRGINYDNLFLNPFRETPPVESLTTINSTHRGITAIVLTWVGVFALCIDLGLWTQAWVVDRRVRKQERAWKADKAAAVGPAAEFR